MLDANPVEKIEYRVIPITRFQVTRFIKNMGKEPIVEVKGEFQNADVAYEVGYALCKSDHGLTGWPPADSRIQYPQIQAGAAKLGLEIKS